MSMLGSRIFSYLSGVTSVEKIGLTTMMIGAASHIVILLTNDVVIRFFAFLAFEACVGIYFPMMGTLKGDIVPEEMRSTIYNIYRFPLNVLVLLPLLLNFSISTTFIVTTTILAMSAFSSFTLMQMRDSAGSKGNGAHGSEAEMQGMVMGQES